MSNEIGRTKRSVRGNDSSFDNDRRNFLKGLTYGCGALVTGALSPVGVVRAVPGSRTFGSAPQQITEITGSVNGHTVPAGETHEITGTLTSDANVIVNGTLRMRPGSTLRFVNVDESRYVGGGLNPIARDVGLWVMGQGQLDVQGTPKTAWNRTGNDSTWIGGDELVLTPTAAGDTVGFSNFTAGGNVPVVNGRWRAEVLNLTRDILIEGTPGGRAHVLIRSSRPQIIRYCEIRNMGPRQGPSGSSDGVLGRYPLHFHHAGEGVRGTEVEGVVVAHSGNHGFVPHMSHGITFTDCIAYDVFESVYWWDAGDISNDIHYHGCVAALAQEDPPFRGFRLTGFNLGRGTGNICRGCVGVGIQGAVDASGFEWPESANQAPNVWVFEDCVAHNNNANGIFVWQNTSTIHDVRRFVAYRCGLSGIDHGAYGNTYHFSDMDLFENTRGIEQHAQERAPAERNDRTDGYGMSFDNVRITGGEYGVVHTGHVLPAGSPCLFKDVRFVGQSIAKVAIDEANGSNIPGRYDYVNCNLLPADVQRLSTNFGMVLRGQNRGTAWRMTSNGSVSLVNQFYPQFRTFVG